MQKSVAKRITTAWFAALLLVSSLPARATVVFDPTNFIENLISAMQNIEMVAEQAKSYSLDLQRYQNELRQAAAFNPNSLIFRDASEDFKNSLQILNDLRSIYGNVKSAKSIMETEMRMYSMSRHKSFEDYITHDMARAEREGRGRVSAFQAERNAIQTAHKQMEQVRQLADQIKAPAGLQQSMQTANQQLNLMAAQNAQLMQVIASKQALDNQNAAMEAAKKQSEMEGEKKAVKAMRASVESFKRWAEE